jgi:hypothetical protein
LADQIVAIKMCRAGGTCGGEEKCIQNFGGNADLFIDGRIILKWMSKKYGRMALT